MTVNLMIAFPESVSQLFDSFSLSIFSVPGTQQKSSLFWPNSELVREVTWKHNRGQ